MLGKCAICERAPEHIREAEAGNLKALAVDHDHSCCPGARSCGKCVRGLLCSACNTGIGSLRDDPTLLMQAIAYLTR